MKGIVYKCMLRLPLIQLIIHNLNIIFWVLRQPLGTLILRKMNRIANVCSLDRCSDRFLTWPGVKLRSPKWPGELDNLSSLTFISLMAWTTNLQTNQRMKSIAFHSEIVCKWVCTYIHVFWRSYHSAIL